MKILNFQIRYTWYAVFGIIFPFVDNIDTRQFDDKTDKESN